MEGQDKTEFLVLYSSVLLTGKKKSMFSYEGNGNNRELGQIVHPKLGIQSLFNTVLFLPKIMPTLRKELSSTRIQMTVKDEILPIVHSFLYTALEFECWFKMHGATRGHFAAI